MADAKLRINEIYPSIQGESTWAGLPCVFVRLTGCHLRCTYCDTSYAFTQGDFMPLAEVVQQACGYGIDLVELTGGEPLLQPEAPALIAELCDRGKTVLIETSGACDISVCDPRSIRILDLKTPGSGEMDRNDLGNLQHLRERDEIKFVITDRADYEWARQMVAEHDLAAKVAAVHFSPVYEQAGDAFITGCVGLNPRDLAEWIVADRLPVRLQIQLHKVIWDPQQRGV